MDNAQQHLQQLIKIKTRHLQKLELQQAKLGLNTPPHILLEIEDLSSEIQQLENRLAQLLSGTSSLLNLTPLLEIEPRVLRVSSNGATQQLTCTNFSGHPYRDVQIRLKAGWPVTLGRMKFALNDLSPGAQQTIEFPLKVTAEPGQHFPLTAKIRVDDYKLFELTLRVWVEEPVKTPKLPGSDSTLSQKIPSRFELRKELEKLVVVETQLQALCDLPDFEVLTDDVIDPLLSSSRKVKKIMDFCIARNKQAELHQALKKILGSDYTFVNR